MYTFNNYYISKKCIYKDIKRINYYIHNLIFKDSGFGLTDKKISFKIRFVSRVMKMIPFVSGMNFHRILYP